MFPFRPYSAFVDLILVSQIRPHSLDLIPARCRRFSWSPGYQGIVLSGARHLEVLLMANDQPPLAFNTVK